MRAVQIHSQVWYHMHSHALQTVPSQLIQDLKLTGWGSRLGSDASASTLRVCFHAEACDIIG